MPDRLRITGKAVYDELLSRGVAVEIVEAKTGLLRYTNGGTTRYVQSCLTDTSSPIGRNIADRKLLASDIAAYLGLQQPASLFYTDDDTAARFLEQYKTVVVKPNDGAHGNGITVGVTSLERLKIAIETALSASRGKKVLIQEQIYGSDIRVLVIGKKVAAAAVREPASVTGDGKSTVHELIVAENTNPLRGVNYRMPLNRIDSSLAAEYLGENFETHIPSADEAVQVTGTANIGTGGKATDITDLLPEAICDQAVKMAEELGQDCCGVDFIASDVSDEKTYYFLEINASPSFGLHMKPSVGKPRDVQKIFVDLLLSSN